MPDIPDPDVSPEDAADCGPRVRRQLVDGEGVRWDVWRCVPSATSKGLNDAFVSGWLTFESTTGEKRRSAPAPEAWRGLEDGELLRLLGLARPARPAGVRSV